MLLLIKFSAKILKILNSEVSPQQIAAGFAFGALLGFVPAKGILPYCLLLTAFLININLPMMFVGAAIFKILSFLLDPLFNQIGFALLVQAEGLKSLWTALYNAPAVPFTRFNNTIVLGSLVSGIVLLIPAYFFMRWFVVFYRTKLQERILKLKIVQIFKASSFYKYYLSYKGITGE